MQQVNLYSDILKHQQNQSGIKLYITLFVAVLLLGIGFSSFLLWGVNAIETELQHAQLTLEREKSRVNEFISKTPKQELNAQLLAEIQMWQNSVNEATQTLQLLAGGEAILSQGFSGYFEALANQSDPEVWLTAIHIDGQNRGMRIEGSTFKPELVPQALEHLQQEPAFTGSTFAKLMMQESTRIAGQMDFTLSSFEQLSMVKDHAQ